MLHRRWVRLVLPRTPDNLSSLSKSCSSHANSWNNTKSWSYSLFPQGIPCQRNFEIITAVCKVNRHAMTWAYLAVYCKFLAIVTCITCTARRSARCDPSVETSGALDTLAFLGRWCVTP